MTSLKHYSFSGLNFFYTNVIIIRVFNSLLECSIEYEI